MPLLTNPWKALTHPETPPAVRLRMLLAGLILGGVLVCSVTLLAGQALSAADAAPARATQSAALEALQPLKTLCLGGAGQGAAAGYTPGAGPHRLVVFRSNIAGSADLATFYNRTEDYPADWQAADLPQAALVACVHTASAVVEACAYNLAGGAQATLQRVQLSAAVALYAARTGALVGQAVLPGAEPRACQPQETFPAGVTTQSVSGAAVPPAQIQAWLAAYVE